MGKKTWRRGWKRAGLRGRRVIGRTVGRYWRERKRKKKEGRGESREEEKSYIVENAGVLSRWKTGFRITNQRGMCAICGAVLLKSKCCLVKGFMGTKTRKKDLYMSDRTRRFFFSCLELTPLSTLGPHYRRRRTSTWDKRRRRRRTATVCEKLSKKRGETRATRKGRMTKKMRTVQRFKKR